MRNQYVISGLHRRENEIVALPEYYIA